MGATAGDTRVTGVGRFIRKTRLDELPQLWNVVRGDMSLVGPRPERPFFVAQFEVEVTRYGDRHRVPGGLTGWAQIHGLRGDSSIEERARFDNQYIENWSLWRDIVVLPRTARAVLCQAFQGEHWNVGSKHRTKVIDLRPSRFPTVVAADAIESEMNAAASHAG